MFIIFNNNAHAYLLAFLSVKTHDFSGFQPRFCTGLRPDGLQPSPSDIISSRHAAAVYASARHDAESALILVPPAHFDATASRLVGKVVRL